MTKDSYGRCVVCGYRDGHHRKIHFVHDHMGWLEATSIIDGYMIRRPAPWTYTPRIRKALVDAWANYSLDA